MDDLQSVISTFSTMELSLQKTTGRLEELQERYNKHLIHADQVRLREHNFLQERFENRPDEFPTPLRERIATLIPVAKSEFESSLIALRSEIEDQQRELVRIDGERLKFIETVESENQRLDNREERLKVDVESYREEVEALNSEILEMSSGLGFFTNLLGAHRVERSRQTLLSEKRDLLDKLTKVRAKWEESESKYGDKRESLRTALAASLSSLALSEERLERLEREREILIPRSAFTRAIAEISGEESYLRPGAAYAAVQCKYCQMTNEKNHFICDYCGEPFGDDQPDIIGSLCEYREVLAVHGRLLLGIEGSVSMLAMLRGVSEGVESIRKSYQSVRSSQQQHGLTKLRIALANEAQQMLNQLGSIESGLDSARGATHPQAILELYRSHVEPHFTADFLERLFRGAGDRLKEATDSQW